MPTSHTVEQHKHTKKCTLSSCAQCSVPSVCCVCVVCGWRQGTAFPNQTITSTTSLERDEKKEAKPKDSPHASGKTQKQTGPQKEGLGKRNSHKRNRGSKTHERQEQQSALRNQEGDRRTDGWGGPTGQTPTGDHPVTIQCRGHQPTSSYPN